MKRKMTAMVLAAAMVAGLTMGCGSDGDKPADAPASDEGQKQDDKQDDGADAADDAGSDGEEVTLKLFSNLPDRNNGQGLVEQMIIDEYMEQNKNVKIEVEALDEEAYKIKFKAYSMEGLPDVVSIWGQPAFLDEVLDAGVLAELSQDDYKDYTFVPGSLDGFMKDGKLYGLPRNTDVAGFYYNQKMFEDNGWEVPKTYDDLLALAGKISDAGITPLAMDGGDGWPLAVYLSDILFKLTGPDYASTVSNAIANGDFSDPAYTKAAQLLYDSAKAGLFQNGFDTQDYGTAQNLFTNGQAAMFYMGSWEASMALNEDIPEEVRDNIRVFTMPTIEGGVGTATDIAAWNGGYAVSESSENKEEAIKFLNFMYQPDKLSKYGWENGVGMSAQDQTDYMSGSETELQMQFVDAVNNATSVSGTPINDCGPSEFKTVIEIAVQGVSNGSLSVDEFLQSLAEACQ